MKKKIKRRIKWNPSRTPGVVAHRVYVGKTSIVIPMPKTECIVPDEFPGMFEDGKEYTFGVSAIDEDGNESEIASNRDQKLVFRVAPPTGVTLE